MPTAREVLPTNVDAERLVLGSILLDDNFFAECAGGMDLSVFSLEKHRRIFKRMGDLYSREERIDRITVANELNKHGELDSCDGLSYLVSLDDGLPQLPKVQSYVDILNEKARLRSLATGA
jgi:replicative DNA helicase